MNERQIPKFHIETGKNINSYNQKNIAVKEKLDDEKNAGLWWHFHSPV